MSEIPLLGSGFRVYGLRFEDKGSEVRVLVLGGSSAGFMVWGSWIGGFGFGGFLVVGFWEAAASTGPTPGRGSVVMIQGPRFRVWFVVFRAGGLMK